MTEIKRVTIPVEVADAIEYLKNPPQGVYTNWDNEQIIDCVLKPAKYHADYEKAIGALRSIEFDTLLSALVNGYEREMTAEQRAHEEIKREYSDVSNNWDFACGIWFTLDKLGIKIEGVTV